jgi:hypothetical protein
MALRRHALGISALRCRNLRLVPRVVFRAYQVAEATNHNAVFGLFGFRTGNAGNSWRATKNAIEDRCGRMACCLV